MHRLLGPFLLPLLSVTPSAAQFALQGDYSDLTVTTFAEGLNFPVGMAELPDGSLLVGLSNGTSFYSATSGRLVRLVDDDDDDGVAEAQQALAEAVPGASPTAVRRAGDLVFVTGQGQPIVVYRLGSSAADPLALVGQMTITYPSPWQHKHSALLARLAPDAPGTVELYFQVGSAQNFAATTQTAALTSDLGVEGTLAGDALYRVLITDDGAEVAAADVEQIATGLRNASGFAFHPETGDLYLADNGIDGLEDASESFSADEINVIPAGQIGGAVEDFGFPDTYVVYRTGEVVGETGLPPLVAFQPIPDPQTGAESEGPNDIAFAPPVFEPALDGGLFVGFHGQFGSGGLENEENPLVFVAPDGASYAHFVGVDEPGVVHLDGLLARGRDLFVADLATTGRLGANGADTGAVYRIRYTGNVVNAGTLPARAEASLTAYPNPFREAAALTLAVRTAQRVRVVVYDLLGREVAVLYDGAVHAGAALRLRLGEELARGIYFVRASGPAFRLTRRVIRLH